MSEDEALGALAAFIRVRTEAEREYRAHVAATLPTNEDIHQLLDGLDAFLVEGSPDRPLRLQAVVGGLVRATGVPVSAQGITDPSRHAPGDAHVPDAYEPTWAAEVKGRHVPLHEAKGFIDNAREYGVPAVWLVAIAHDHDPLNRAALAEAARSSGLMLGVIEDVVELVAAVLGHPAVEPSRLNDAAVAIGQQLRDMEASGDTLDAWAALFV